MRQELFANDPKQGHVEETTLVAIEQEGTLFEHLETLMKEARRLRVPKEQVQAMVSATYAVGVKNRGSGQV